MSGDLADDDALRAHLTAIMAAPDYQPVLVPAWWAARQARVTPQAISVWAQRADRTGVRRYPCGRYDLNAIALWELTRDRRQAARRRRGAA